MMMVSPNAFLFSEKELWRLSLRPMDSMPESPGKSTGSKMKFKSKIGRIPNLLGFSI